MDDAEFQRSLAEALAGSPLEKTFAIPSAVAAEEMGWAILAALSDRFGGGFASDVRDRLAMRAEKLRLNGEPYSTDCATIIDDCLADDGWTRLQALPG